MSMGTSSAGDEQTTELGVLTEEIVETMSAQERDGTVQVSIPKAGARALGIEKGDTVLITGESGGRSLTVQKPTAAQFR